MKARLIIIPIDDICRLFQDYTYLTGFPADAKADTLLFNRATMDMCLRVVSDEWDRDQPPEEVNFDLRRTFIA